MALSFFQRLLGNTSVDAPSHKVRFFIETMLIMISADGEIADAEMSQFMDQLRNRPELDGMSWRALDEHVRTAFSIIKRDGVEQRLKTIADALPSHDARRGALSMALSVAVGDGSLSPAEHTVMQMIQDAFGLTDPDVESALVAAQDNQAAYANREANAPNAREQALLEIMLMMAVADGVLAPSEVERFGHELAERDTFSGLSPSRVGVFMDRALRNLQRDGVETSLKRAADALPDPDDRVLAFHLALRMCIVDGSADPHERTLLKLIQEKLELDDAIVSNAITEVLTSKRNAEESKDAAPSDAAAPSSEVRDDA